MSEENATNSPESPGSLLKAKRIESDFTIEQITADTKISASVIRAIEQDDFTALPAPAFTKGFYALYAQSLGLDVEEVVGLYQTLHSGQTNKKKKEVAPSDVGALTKRPFVPIFSLIGFTLLLLLLIFGTLSWYFSWNPADFLSQQLRGVETEYHEVDNGDTEQHPSSAPTLSQQNQGAQLKAENSAIIQFPITDNSQGIEISELTHTPPQLPLNTASISPKSTLTEATPQTVLQ